MYCRPHLYSMHSILVWLFTLEMNVVYFHRISNPDLCQRKMFADEVLSDVKVHKIIKKHSKTTLIIVAMGILKGKTTITWNNASQCWRPLATCLKMAKITMLPMVAKGRQSSRGTPGLVEMSKNQNLNHFPT